MSKQFEFKISIHHLIINTVIVLFGLTVASVFLRFASQDLLSSFTARLEDYFVFSSPSQIIILALQECFWLALIISLSMVPYGKLLSCVILFYKGFSIGVVASIFCVQYALAGIKYILLLLFPPNALYVISLCIAAQISAEVSVNTINRGRHSRTVKTDTRAYIGCAVLTVLAAVLEAVGVPWIYQIFF